METKYCKRCDSHKPRSDFNKRTYKSGTVGYSAYCKSCNRSYLKEHYEKDKPSYIRRGLKQRQKVREQYRELKESKPCTDCRLYFPYYVMQFDHINLDKNDTVSNIMRSGAVQKMLDEMAKCEIVCSNCHAERTHQRKNDEGSSNGRTIDFESMNRSSNL